MIDWSQPLEAIDLKTGQAITVRLDASYTRLRDVVPVRFPCNAWTGQDQPGTWYIDGDGYAIAGKSPDGYNGRFRVRNVAVTFS